jgi:DNA-binding PadR family transcriptional regulator
MVIKNLGSSAYVVLGLAMQHREITPYDLKRRIATSIGYFWSYSHPQIYAVTERLRENGLLSQRQETTGRRRKLYRATRKGEKVFNTWLKEPVQSHTELRDLALLKLYFGEFADESTIADMARQQAAAHRARLAEYRNIPRDRQIGHFAAKTVELGIEFEKIAAKYWLGIEAEYS